MHMTDVESPASSRIWSVSIQGGKSLLRHSANRGVEWIYSFSLLIFFFRGSSRTWSYPRLLNYGSDSKGLDWCMKESDRSYLILQIYYNVNDERRKKGEFNSTECVIHPHRTLYITILFVVLGSPGGEILLVEYMNIIDFECITATGVRIS